MKKVKGLFRKLLMESRNGTRGISFKRLTDFREKTRTSTRTHRPLFFDIT